MATTKKKRAELKKDSAAAKERDDF